MDDAHEDDFSFSDIVEVLEEIEESMLDRCFTYSVRMKILLHFVASELLENSDSLDHAIQSLLAFSNALCKLIELADSHGEAAWNKRRSN